MKQLTWAWLVLALLWGGQVQAGSGVVINRLELTAEQLTQLEWQLGTKVQPGRYWYDSRSGLWGWEGNPSIGQLPPGMPSAPLPEDVSTGGTNVFINGREIHPSEYWALV